MNQNSDLLKIKVPRLIHWDLTIICNHFSILFQIKKIDNDHIKQILRHIEEHNHSLALEEIWTQRLPCVLYSNIET